jgi:pimeloyl-ACP methyl ester carboxylesterase
MVDLHYAYLHGFGAGPDSFKGTALRERMASEGRTLHLPDLQQPSFEKLTVTAALRAMDTLDATIARDGGKWCLVGSSMGGYLAALWAAQHPARVARLLLLCPGFDLGARWTHFIGAEALSQWENEGSLTFTSPHGESRKVHWAFVTDARQHPGWPNVPCPTHIIHGLRDEAVPHAMSIAYAANRPHVTVETVEDDHGLASSLDVIWHALNAMAS